jgi:hypothetical protein
VRDEDEELGLSEAIWPERERPEDRERMSRVDLDLGSLVPVLDVLHGEVVEIQLSLQRDEVLRARLDGVDPDPGIPGQVGRYRAEAVEGHGVGFEDPVPEDPCLHPRSVPGRSGTRAKEPHGPLGSG